MQTFEAVRAAVGGHTKAVRDELKLHGMRRCSTSLVERQWKAPVPGVSIGWYCAFWRLLLALWSAHRDGAEMLLADLGARVEALRAGDVGASPGDYRELLARCETEHGDVVRAELLGQGRLKLIEETLQAIAAKRRLVAALLVAEEEDAARGRHGGKVFAPAIRGGIAAAPAGRRQGAAPHAFERRRARAG